MTAGDLGTAGHVQHIAHAQELLCPHFAEDGAAVDFRGHLERNPGGEVGLDGTGDHIHRGALCGHDQVNTRGPRHLRKTLNTGLDLLARYHHQISHLIDDHHDIGQRLGSEFIRLEHWLASVIIKSGLHRAAEHLALGQGFLHPTIVAGDVAHTHLGHLAVAIFHFAHYPFQRHDCLFGVGHNRRQQMWDTVIDGKLQHLGVDHDQAAFLW